MALTPVEAIPSIGKADSKTVALIEEFQNSGVEMARVDDEVGKGFASLLNKRARQSGAPVRAVKRGDELYLERFDWSGWTPPNRNGGQAEDE